MHVLLHADPLLPKVQVPLDSERSTLTPQLLCAEPKMLSLGGKQDCQRSHLVVFPPP
jgi:hypothetical protein